MIFVTDAAILYAYMIGDVPVWLGELLPASARRCPLRAVVVGVGGGGCLPAFRGVGLCRAAVVRAAGQSGRSGGEERPHRVRQFFTTMVWAVLLSVTVIASILMLPCCC